MFRRRGHNRARRGCRRRRRSRLPRNDRRYGRAYGRGLDHFGGQRSDAGIVSLRDLVIEEGHARRILGRAPDPHAGEFRLYLRNALDVIGVMMGDQNVRQVQPRSADAAIVGPASGTSTQAVAPVTESGRARRNCRSGKDTDERSSSWAAVPVAFSRVRLLARARASRRASTITGRRTAVFLRLAWGARRSFPCFKAIAKDRAVVQSQGPSGGYRDAPRRPSVCRAFTLAPRRRVRRLIGRVIRERWDHSAGLSVAAVGYGAPYLERFRDSARRCLAFMPAEQGVADLAGRRALRGGARRRANAAAARRLIDRLLSPTPWKRPTGPTRCSRNCGASPRRRDG